MGVKSREKGLRLQYFIKKQVLNIACFNVVALNLQVINGKTVLIENKCFDSRLSKLVIKTGVRTYK